MKWARTFQICLYSVQIMTLPYIIYFALLSTFGKASSEQHSNIHSKLSIIYIYIFTALISNKVLISMFNFIGYIPYLFVLFAYLLFLSECLECLLKFKSVNVIGRTGTEPRLVWNALPIRLSQTALFRAKRKLLAFMVRCAGHVHIRNVPVVSVLIGVEGLEGPPFIRAPRATLLAIPVFRS